MTQIPTIAGLVTKLCQHGHVNQAVEALGLLMHTDCHISKSVLYTVLNKCVLNKDLYLGRRVHAFTVGKGYQSDTFLCNHILRMYASHGRLQDAMDVFEEVPRPDAFMWSSIISAHVRHEQDKQAIQLYHRMRRASVKPDGHVFVAALQACARGADLETGQQVHADLLASGIEPDVFVCSSLVHMYAKCGMGQEALRLYSAMQEQGIPAPDSVTFVCLLQACAKVGAPALEKGKELHAQIGDLGLPVDVDVGCSLVNMYSKCGSLEDAQIVFDGLSQKDVVTWNAMLAGYSQQGLGQEALYLHAVMQQEGIVPPDSVTFVCLLQACASVGTPALEKGKHLHAQIREQGVELDLVVACSLVNMYAKCGSLEDAKSVFLGIRQKDVATWNAMIAGYSQQGMGGEALHLYTAMQEEGATPPNSATLVCLLQACASMGTPALEKGRQLHAQIGEQGLQADACVAHSLITMYAKCGSLEDAQIVFDGIDKKDVVTWNSIIAGYSQQGMGEEALQLYTAMQKEGIAQPDSVTFVSLLQASASAAALHAGRHLHAQIEEQGLQADGNVCNSLVNMYAKCGSMVDAQQVFDALPERDVFAWNALIAGYTRQGQSDVVFDLLHRMTDDGIPPNDITFLGVLTVCSHVGLVDKGREHFESMSKHYGITPTAEHYSCMVDLLGRSGQLDEALAVVRTMPVEPLDSVWHSLLGSCQKWSNVEVGRHAFMEAVKLDERDATAFVSMSNIYTSAQMWEEAEEMQKRRKEMGAWKQPGRSWWTDLGGQMHRFVVGDKEHPESELIYARLKQLDPEMKKQGYVPHLNSSSQVVLDETNKSSTVRSRW